jgi:hypothetical protein
VKSSQRIPSRTRDQQVIQHGHSYDKPSTDEPPSELEIVPTRVETTRRMVVENNHPGSATDQHLAKKLTCIDRRLTSSTSAELFDGQQPMPGIKTHDSEDFDSVAAEMGNQEAACELRTIEANASFELRPHQAPSDLYRSKHGCALGRAETRSMNQLGGFDAGKSGDSTHLPEQGMRLFHDVRAFATRSHQHC